jgi:adenylate kinase family enzyme
LKSTTAAALATILGVPSLSLDTVMWKPGWGMTPPDEFQAAVRSFIDQHQETGWVADGDYMRRGGVILHEEATDVVCE